MCTDRRYLAKKLVMHIKIRHYTYNIFLYKKLYLLCTFSLIYLFDYF
jgi:hypothetical protein